LGGLTDRQDHQEALAVGPSDNGRTVIDHSHRAVHEGGVVADQRQSNARKFGETVNPEIDEVFKMMPAPSSIIDGRNAFDIQEHASDVDPHLPVPVFQAGIDKLAHLDGPCMVEQDVRLAFRRTDLLRVSTSCSLDTSQCT